VLLASLLAELSDLWVGMSCGVCGNAVHRATKALAQGIDPTTTLDRVLASLRCQQCGAPPGRVVITNFPGYPGVEVFPGVL
jgi:hypothetical protein